MSNVLLIDGDYYVYQIAAVLEVPFHWGDDMWTLQGDVGEGKVALEDLIAGLMDDLDADDVVFAFSAPYPYFRHEFLPEYKANRRDKRKPFLYPMLKEYLEKNYVCVQRPLLEGDDVLGILSTMSVPAFSVVTGVDAGDERIIVSVDKDMQSIPGLLYNTMHSEEGITGVSEESADYYHMYQTLIGDTTDGYKGCPGIGPVKAQRLFIDAEPKDYWSVVVEAYEDAGLTEEDALIQARVARILRAEDYNFKEKRVIPWEPK